MSKELVSIIVPVYNCEKYLERCVSSLIQQTYGNIEIILVDDGSTDGSFALCEKMSQGEKRIIVTTKKNGGASSARNVGLSLAKGEYIVFVDSDDWVEFDMVECFVGLLEQNEADMVIGEFSTKNKVAEEWYIWDKSRCFEHFFRTRGEGDTHSVCGRLYKRDVFSEFSFLEGRMNEDVLACYQIANRCEKVVYTTKEVYHYQCNSEGVTNSLFSKKKLDLLYVWGEVHKLVEKDNLEFLRICEVNEARARFTLLSQMYLNGYDKSDPEMKQIKQKLKKYLRRHYWELLKWKMPVSRKIFLTVICVI